MLLKKLANLSIKLIDYINISKVLDNYTVYMSRCKCTDGDSKGGIWLVGALVFL